MADLTFVERAKLERLLGMSSGYVLDFSNRTFAEFVAESAGRDIYDDRYDYGSGSKANRLRGFWAEEPNHVAGKLTSDLLDYFESQHPSHTADPQLDECRRIAQRMLDGAPVADFDAVSSGLSGKDFDVVVRAVHEAIDKNDPEGGLDRLHTFTVKYVSSLAEARGVALSSEKPLHSVFAEYVKKLKTADLIESEMTERILKSTIGTMEAFNWVRNDQSLAHDNPVLNHEESLLIFNHICSVLRFLQELEVRAGGG